MYHQIYKQHCVYLNMYTQCQIMLFDVMIDRLHDVALTVGSSLGLLSYLLYNTKDAVACVPAMGLVF